MELRKDWDVMVYGKYLPLLEQHPQVFAYRRSLEPTAGCRQHFSGEHVERSCNAHGIAPGGGLEISIQCLCISTNSCAKQDVDFVLSLSHINVS